MCHHLWPQKQNEESHCRRMILAQRETNGWGEKQRVGGRNNQTDVCCWWLPAQRARGEEILIALDLQIKSPLQKESLRKLHVQPTFHSPTALLLQGLPVARHKTSKLPNLYNWVSMYKPENTPRHSEPRLQPRFLCFGGFYLFVCF